jgi:hypothetical protein
MSDIMDRIIRGATLRLPGAIENVIKDELFLVLDEFLQKTSMWQEEITFGVTSDATEYELVPTGGTIVQLIHLANSDEIPVKASMATPSTLVLQNTPNTDTFTATVALTVVDPTTRDHEPEVPEWILTKYHLVVLDGVLGRMMSQPMKSYTSDKHSIYHMRRFRNGMAGAAAQTKRSNRYGGQSWSFPQSFAVRRRR